MLLEGVEGVEDAEEGLLPPVDESESVAPGRVLTTCSDTVVASLCHRCILPLSLSLSPILCLSLYHFTITFPPSPRLFYSALAPSVSRIPDFASLRFRACYNPCKYTHTHTHTHRRISTSRVFSFSPSIFASIIEYFHSLSLIYFFSSFLCITFFHFSLSLSLFLIVRHLRSSYVPFLRHLAVFVPVQQRRQLLCSAPCVSAVSFIRLKLACKPLSSLNVKTFLSLVARPFSQPMNTSFRLYTGCPALLSIPSFARTALLCSFPYFIIFYSFSICIRRWIGVIYDMKEL